MEIDLNDGNPTRDLVKELEPMKDTPIAPAHGIAAMALNFALKYHDIQMVKDGALYQQYKLEGRNFTNLHLDHVFETAIRIEMHLLAASERIAKVVIDAIAAGPIDEEEIAEGDQGTAVDEQITGEK